VASWVFEWLLDFWSGFQGFGVDSMDVEWIPGFSSVYKGFGADSSVFEWQLGFKFQSFEEARSVLLWLQDSRGLTSRILEWLPEFKSEY